MLRSLSLLFGRLSTKIALALALALGAGLAIFPLFGRPGAESAFVLGLLLPVLGGIVGARVASDPHRDAGALLGEATLGALLLWVLPVLLLAINMLRVRTCEPLLGFAFLALGPGIGTIYAAHLGLFFAGLTRRPSLAAWLGALAPIAALLLGLWRFYSGPAIAFYGHFAGYFPGLLYDVGTTLSETYFAFRATTLVWLSLLVVGFATLWEEDDRGFGLPPNLPGSIVSLVLLVAGVGLELAGGSLGFRSSVATIDETLGSVEEGMRCVVHAPRELGAADRERLIEDCDFRVRRAEEALGVTLDAPVQAFFYRNAAEKQRLMGAGRTYMAKPWRREVHLQLQAWPHPVLRHEVIHAVASAAADGPFHVGGGLVPNPGLIEGVAVAIDWDEVDGLDPHDWARAMRASERLPPLVDVMGLDFLRLPHRNAYAAAGSFVRFLLDAEGAEKLVRAHRSGEIEATYGRTMEELEAAWHAHLDGEELDERARALAELRFARPSIFQTTCPHRLSRLGGQLGADLAAADGERVEATCAEILEIEPHHFGALAARVRARMRRGDRNGASEALEALSGAPPQVLASAREAMADALWLRGETDEAARLYRALLELPQTDGEARAREVKLAALDAGGEQAAIVRDLLIGAEGRRPGGRVVVHLAHRLRAVRRDGLGDYLLARQLMSATRWDLALPHVMAARERGLPTERLRRELGKMSVIANFAAGELEAASAALRRLEGDGSLGSFRADWRARIADLDAE